jgi:NADPH:quinone reductase-like Zn-dependent oxidoreductase
MKTVRIHEHGGPEVLRLEEIAAPEPGPGEVRLEVRAVGLNHLDLWVRRGVPGHTFPLPITPSSDAAGIVEALGPGAGGLREGEKAVLLPGYSCGRCAACLRGDDNLCPGYGILGESRDGACAELVVVPEANVMPLPDGLSWEEGAAFGLVFQTAWNMIVRKARLQPGEWALIHAAGSGVGSAALQVAHLLGARVLATAGSEEKLEGARRLGAHHALDYRDEDWHRRVHDLTSGEGVDVVIDSVGQDTFLPSLKLLAKGGRYVTCGATSGFEMSADFRLVFFKNLEILGSTMGRKGDLRRIARLMESERLRPVIDRVLPFEQVADAHRVLEARAAFGKVVLSLD